MNKEDGIVVLSCFDGMSCGQIALERAGIKVRKYYASEIDKYAMTITQKNYPDTIQLGDIQNWQEWDIETPDLIIAGSPCQGFSNAGHGLNFDDPRSKLFFTFKDILFYWVDKNPKLKWMLENVKMKQIWRDVIIDVMGVEPVLINSALVSAQNRQRLYWANWDIPQPEDKNLLWKDVHESWAKNVFYYTKKSFHWINKDEKRRKKFKVYCKDTETKMQMLEASHYKGYSNERCFGVQDDDGIRYISVLECERLQTVPERYTEGVSNTQRYRMLGNGWTVDVIAHIFKHMQ
jgi:DNA-cytosine methyltransferase